MAVRQLDALPGDVGSLFAHALRLIRSIGEQGIKDPFWTFGGGTVLMLRHGHRKSRDIHIFVPDAQYLGYLNPRLSFGAESVTTNYVETAGFIKLVLPKGEIDFVAAPNLTEHAFEDWQISGTAVRVGTAAEIVAKTARDLFDLAIVAQEAPEQIKIAAPWFERHKSAFLAQIQTRKAVLQAQFGEIDTIGFHPSYTECVASVSKILEQL